VPLIAFAQEQGALVANDARELRRLPRQLEPQHVRVMRNAFPKLSDPKDGRHSLKLHSRKYGRF
jgi:hypothetical protein